MHAVVRANCLMALVMLLFLITGVPSRSQEAVWEAEVTGLWEQVVESVNDPRFVIELEATDDDEFRGTVHTFTGDIKEGEFHAEQISLEDSLLEFVISPFHVRFRGALSLDSGMLKGKLLNPDGSEQRFTLRKTDPAALVGLYPRSLGEEYAYTQPLVTDDGWESCSLEDAGMDSTFIDHAVERIVAGDCGLLNSLLIVKDGALVLEEYFYGYDRETLHLISSNTKSICSLLIGIAMDRGYIPSLDEAVFSFYPEYDSLKTDRSAKITLRHLLTMTAGFKLSGMIMEETDNRLKTALERDVIFEPGQVFQYDEGSANLLAGVIKHATGKHADVFAEECLFKPLDIKTYNWEEEKQNGYPCCQGSLELRPRDMARIGQLVLNGGVWNGNRIVSSEWLLESTNAHAKDDYGYMWWRGQSKVNERIVESIVATGIGSQFICIFPSLDTVVVMTGSNYHNGMTPEPVRVLEQYVLMAIMADERYGTEEIPPDKNPASRLP
jgi:CubicO group peptidase (beta-lactamase class C family)